MVLRLAQRFLKQNRDLHTTDQLYRKFLRRYEYLKTVTFMNMIAYVLLAINSASPILLLMVGMFTLALMICTALLYLGDPTDALAFSQAIFKKAFPDDDGDLRANLRTMAGSVYILQDVEISHWYKIGKTDKPANRIGHFDVILPFETKVIHIISSKDASKLETVLHRRFASKRKRGEWFDLSEQDIAWLKEMNEG